MTRYKKLFFDFDDTLVDFKAAEKVALPTVFNEFNFPLTAEVEVIYNRINRSLWDALEVGEVTREQLMDQRFGKTFEHFGIEVNGREVDDRYRQLLAKTIVLIDGAREVLEQLAPNFELYIVTNGMTDTQYARLEAAGLTSYFQQVFVSEEIGYQKPQIQFFDYVFEAIGDVDLASCLIIGDSFSADIAGGVAAGIDTCWFNSNGKRKTQPIEPTYEIAHLPHLLEIIYNK